MSFREVMALPMKVFWFMNSCINRIRADDDMRSLSIASAAAAQSIEAQKATRERLVIEMGEVVKNSGAISDERDEVGFNALRMMQYQRPT
jgi:hypothetical protein